jgi:hypothetical protein
MEDLLKVHQKAYNKVYVFYFIILSLNAILFILVTVNYCLSFYTFNYREENDPDIEITGIQSFNFVSSLDSFEYSPGMSNLGNTGKIYLDCFVGECAFSYTYDCSDEDGSATCTEYEYYEDHGCSDECRKTRFYECSKSFCYGKSRYHYEGNKCHRYDDDDELTNTNSCNADNLILNWKELFYSRNNATSYGKYTYLNSAIESNESCPYGKRNCGILDEFGNILCLPTYEECPINLVTTNINEISGYSGYHSTKVGNKTIYYTNKAYNQTVLGGIFVDSDLMIKYNGIECKILDTSTISELLLHNYNKLYRRSLDFDPYDEEADELDKRGKSYLKACSPGLGKEKNITKMYELLAEYKLNMTDNEYIIKPIKVLFIVSYFISLPGYLVSFLFLFILLSSFNIQNNINSIIACGCKEKGNKLIIIILFISFTLTIVGSILSIINNLHNLGDGYYLNLSSVIISTLIVINYITFSLNILLILFILVFIIYLYKTPELGSDQISYYDQKGYSNKPLNSDFTSVQSEQKDYNGEDQLKGDYKENI